MQQEIIKILIEILMNVSVIKYGSESFMRSLRGSRGTVDWQSFAGNKQYSDPKINIYFLFKSATAL